MFACIVGPGRILELAREFSPRVQSPASERVILDLTGLDRLMGSPADIAGICLFLASPLSSYVSGAAIEAHGGGEWPSFLAAAAGAGE